jgi:hypothetical protein
MKFFLPVQTAVALSLGMAAMAGSHQADVVYGDEGDHRLQAYCYRMCLTDAPDNRVKIGKPEGYNEADYEILFRAIKAGQKGDFFKLSHMPNRKADSNNNGGISTDFIGMNYGPEWNWATLDHKGREKLAAKHRDWQLGLVWTLQNHPRVPEDIRKFYAPWGLPKDEFTSNGHWPYNLYVEGGKDGAEWFALACKDM